MIRFVAVLLSISLSSACATMRAESTGIGQPSAPPLPNRALMVAYLQKLPIGARVRATLIEGRTLHGTLMKVDDTAMVLQPRTRVPEAPLEIPIDQIRTVEIEKSGGIGKAMAVGAAVGAGAAIGVLMILAAIFAD